MESPNVNSPAALTGCVSKLSIIKLHKHAYFDALKDYALHYADAQDYLADDGWHIEHDDTLIKNGLSELDHGLLGDDGEPATFAQISDDDIDRCGYMGWLKH